VSKALKRGCVRVSRGAKTLLTEKIGDFLFGED
jgi:hypothetical protein